MKIRLKCGKRLNVIIDNKLNKHFTDLSINSKLFEELFNHFTQNVMKTFKLVMGAKKNVYEKRKVESNLDLPSTLRFS